MSDILTHWADINADKIIRERGEKDLYVCASGITPSGTVHIGNFREIISVALVAQALRERGKKVRFIYSWDDYDVFRKVPANMPRQDLLKEYLRKPITLVPDVIGECASYAEANEKQVEKVLPVVGIFPEFIYQAARYRDSKYAEGIKKALEHKDVIMQILNEHRQEPLKDDWMPVSVFCGSCDLDTTKVTGWDGEWKIGYECSSCGNKEEVDLRQTKAVKLFWRVDWPMRWAEEQVDFEPAGKEHHSAGGSFDTAKKIADAVYNYKAPVTFKYDFIRIKGQGGKISSSAGNVVDLNEVLEIYQPEIVRYLFVSTRPNAEFAISFDLDALKIYEDYDKSERVYYGLQEIKENKRDKEKRIFELSQTGEIPKTASYQIQFRHLCNILQINSGDIEAVIAGLPEVGEDQKERLRVRAKCAWNWVNKYAPEDFRFSLVEKAESNGLEGSRLAALKALKAAVAELEKYDEKGMAEKIYTIAGECGIGPADLFKTVYLALIGKEKGPRLAGFIMTVGKEKIGSILADI